MWLRNDTEIPLGTSQARLFFLHWIKIKKRKHLKQNHPITNQVSPWKQKFSGLCLCIFSTFHSLPHYNDLCMEFRNFIFSFECRMSANMENVNADHFQKMVTDLWGDQIASRKILGQVGAPNSSTFLNFTGLQDGNIYLSGICLVRIAWNFW